MIPTMDGSAVPHLTASQMVEVDRAMIEDFGIDLVQMMENAGRNLAHLARLRFLEGDPSGRSVIVLAGHGGNGGGALVAARRLHNYGARVTVVISRSAQEFAPVPAQQLDILRRMGVPIETDHALADLSAADLVIDGVIGYSLSGAPRGRAATLIEWANQQPAPVLSLDAPSGVDVTDGVVHQPAVRAAATMTLALPKEGLRAAGVDAHVGELYLADISVPRELYSTYLGIALGPLFAEGDLLRLV